MKELLKRLNAKPGRRWDERKLRSVLEKGTKLRPHYFACSANKYSLASTQPPPRRATSVYLIAAPGCKLYMETSAFREVRLLRSVADACDPDNSFTSCVRLLKALKSVQGWAVPGVAIEHTCVRHATAAGKSCTFDVLPTTAPGWLRTGLLPNVRVCLGLLLDGVTENCVVHCLDGDNVLAGVEGLDSASKGLKLLLEESDAGLYAELCHVPAVVRGTR